MYILYIRYYIYIYFLGETEVSKSEGDAFGEQEVIQSEQSMWAGAEDESTIVDREYDIKNFVFTTKEFVIFLENHSEAK